MYTQGVCLQAFRKNNNMSNEKEYRDCIITKHKDGDYSVSGENIMDMGINIHYTKNTIQEIHKAVDDAYIAAKEKADELQSFGEKALEAHKRVAEFDALTRENGRKTIEAAVEAGKSLKAAKSMLKRGQWMPWLEVNCPAISDQTARNYMKVADGVADESKSKLLLNCGSLTEAYVVLGVTSLRKRSEKEKPTTTASAGDGKSNATATTTASTGDGKGSTTATTTATANGGCGTTVDVGGTIKDAGLQDVIDALLMHLAVVTPARMEAVLKAVKPIVDWYDEHRPQKTFDAIKAALASVTVDLGPQANEKTAVAA